MAPFDDEITRQIIGCGMKVHNALGHGFLESVYHRSMEIELAAHGIDFESEKKLNVFYEGKIVRNFIADFFIPPKLIVELKAIETINPVHEVQLVNYLAATGIDVGLLLNFGSESLQTKRKFRKFKQKQALR
ncbi:GxxExxY protein [Verrucomicrobium sp. BvORR106]|uniref:GxxExxY protein n=1 Tax=Verrucomicrobium sp. BvORR106 TaxID=1403819 RepID=UPI00056DEC4F|nr:GxxExxY protein [Verrucomicrobium sp. BvORR106]